jgi:DNA-binding IclR family transcriptional regulator
MQADAAPMVSMFKIVLDNHTGIVFFVVHCRIIVPYYRTNWSILNRHSMRKKPGRHHSAPRYPVKSLEKALAILKLLSKGERDLSLTEIAESLGFSKGTVHRILDTLKAFEFVHQDPSNLRYGLGLQILDLRSASHRDAFLRKVLASPLKRLSEKCREAISAAVLEYNEIRYIARFESSEVLRVSIREGTRLPAHCTATGKVLLSSLSVDYLHRLYGPHAGLVGLTHNSITSFTKLEKELKKVRNENAGYDFEEALVGVNCVARPIRNSKNEVVAAISISGPVSRMTREKMLEFSVLLRDCAHEISTLLGCRGEISAA